MRRPSLLVSTHDSRFALEVCGGRRCRLGLDHRSVHARNAKRPCTQAAPSVADLDRKRRAFEEEDDAHEEHRRWLRRDPAVRGAAPVHVLDAVRRPTFGVPHRALDLAAFSSADGDGGGEGDGLDIRFVQRLLGHQSISTTEGYTTVTDASLRSSITEARARAAGGRGR